MSSQQLLAPRLIKFGRTAVLVASVLVVSLNGLTARPLTDQATTLPAFVLDAARQGTLTDLALAMASAGSGIGILALRGESGEATRPWHLAARTPTVSFDSVVIAFRDSHPGYQLREVHGFFLLTDTWPITQGGPLTKRVASFEVQQASAIDALRTLVRDVSPAAVATGGIVGSALGRPGDAAPTAEEMFGPPVSLHLANTTVFDVLVAIGVECRTLAWIVSGDEGAHSTDSNVFLKAATTGGQVHSIGQLR